MEKTMHGFQIFCAKINLSFNSIYPMCLNTLITSTSVTHSTSGKGLTKEGSHSYGEEYVFLRNDKI